MKNSFADLTSLGVVSTITGIAAITYVATKPFVSFLLALVAIIFCIFAIRVPEQKKLDKWSSWFGVALSLTSIVWILVNIYGR